ncbi:uncharacterized protein [Henckelia pumila]|uniref:uncharacterized protein n=1 Tax=Henckelia pumila TaxID=405737 RepID=UPI003C6DCC83
MGLKGLQELSKQGFLDQNQTTNLEFYESCVLGKTHRLRFNTATHNTKSSLDYIHIDLWGSPQEGKLIPRAKKGIFLGYPTGAKGYRIWLLEDMKCIISRDVIFNETIFYKTNNLDAKSASSDQAEKNSQVADQTHTLDSTPAKNEGGADLNESEDFYDFSHAENQISDQVTETLDTNIEEYSDDLRQDQHLNDYMLARDMVGREIKLPSRFASFDFTAFALNVDELMDLEEPTTYEEAMIEIKFYGNQQFQEFEGPSFKARLFAKGFSQVEGIDYHEVFSPVVNHSSIRILLVITVMQDLELEQLDVKTAFLHGNFEERILMTQPKGFEVGPHSGKVCLLQRSLYGLKQSPRQWYKRFDDFMLQQGYVRSKYDSCVYFRRLQNQSYIYLLIYVDDMLIACKDPKKIRKLKLQLNNEFEMKDLGAAKQILGVEILRDRHQKTLSLTQEKIH